MFPENFHGGNFYRIFFDFENENDVSHKIIKKVVPKWCPEINFSNLKIKPNSSKSGAQIQKGVKKWCPDTIRG
jgi:hypothetical protein